MEKAKKEEKKIRVMTAAYTSSCMDRAKQEQEKVRAAGFGQFTAKSVKGLPGYIMVEAECGSDEEARKLIKDLKEKDISASICK